MNAVPFLTFILIMVACSGDARISNAEVWDVMRTDDTNAMAQVINERGVDGYTTLPFTDKREPLIVLAAENHATNILRHLLEQGADPNATNYQGETALIQLCSYGTAGDSNHITYLIRKGAKINQKRFNGWDALHYAALENKPEICALLLQNGANPNTKDYDGRFLRDVLTNSEIKQMLSAP